MTVTLELRLASVLQGLLDALSHAPSCGCQLTWTPELDAAREAARLILEEVAARGWCR